MTTWCICENSGDSYCIYDQRSLRRMKEASMGSFRCIKHGSILEWAGAKYDNMTRAQVRAALNREAEKDR
jgi:hypothetical protein